MQRLFILLIGFTFFGPFWAQFLTAGLLTWGGITARNAAVGHHSQIERMIEAPQPAPVAIEDYSGGRKSYETEVNLRVLLWTDHNTHLVRKTNFITTGETYFLPFGPAEGEVGETVLGGLMLSEAERKAFMDWALEQPLMPHPQGLMMTIPGVVVPGSDTSHARSALTKQGVSLASDAIFVHPFLTERTAALHSFAAQKGSLSWAYGFWVAAAGFALLGLKKLRRGGRKAPRQAPEPSGAPEAPLRTAAAGAAGAGAAGAAPMRLDPVRLSDFMADRGGQVTPLAPTRAAQVAIVPPALPNLPPQLPTVPSGAGAVVSPRTPAAPEVAPAPARARSRGGYFRRLGFWLLLVVGLGVGARFLPSGVSGNISTLISLACGVAVVGFYLSLVGLDLRAPLDGARSMFGRIRPALRLSWGLAFWGGLAAFALYALWSSPPEARGVYIGLAGVPVGLLVFGWYFSVLLRRLFSQVETMENAMGDIVAGRREAKQGRARRTEDPFDRLHRQLRG